MGAQKKRTAALASRPRGALVHARSNKEKLHIEHKATQLRALASALQRSLEAPANGADTSDPLNADCDAYFKQLRELAFAPHGFVSDELRKWLWPLLLGDEGFRPVAREHVDHFTRKIGPHRDDQQIQKDIDRHYDMVMNIRESERRVKRLQLTQVISAVLNDNEELYYYQGYHDVVSVFLLVLGDQRAFRAVDRVSSTFQREPMRENFEIVLDATRLLYPLLESEDQELFAHIKESGVEPFFALPWMITWFAHQLSRLSDVSRLYDVLLVSHPLFILYLSAAVVVEARHRVVNTDCDFGTLHGLLAKLPQTMEIERVITRAAVIFHRYPPVELLASSENQTELESSMYAQFPFPFHARFRSVDEPFLSPLQYQKRDIHKPSNTLLSKSTGRNATYVVGALAIGLATVSLSFAFRDHFNIWLQLLSADTNDSSPNRK